MKFVTVLTLDPTINIVFKHGFELWVEVGGHSYVIPRNEAHRLARWLTSLHFSPPPEET